MEGEERLTSTQSVSKLTNPKSSTISQMTLFSCENLRVRRSCSSSGTRYSKSLTSV